MRKIALLALVTLCTVFLYACERRDAAEVTQTPQSTTPTPTETAAETRATAVAPSTDDGRSELGEVSDWLVSDVWNSGICAASWYAKNGTGASGETLDIEYTLHRLERAMEKGGQYAAFIDNLDGTDYEEIKYIWGKVYAEASALNEKLQSEPPKPKDSAYKLETDLFRTYMTDFTEEVSHLKISGEDGISIADILPDASAYKKNASLADLSQYLLNKGVISGNSSEAYAQMIGAVGGIKYPDSKVELYQYDINSDAYKNLVATGKVPVQGFGSELTMDAINGPFALYCGQADSKDEIIKAFNSYK